MNIYFDTEFTGLHKDTTLISLGMIDDNGRTFYAEFTDYDKAYNDPWLNENVLAHTIMSGNIGAYYPDAPFKFVRHYSQNSSTVVVGNKEFNRIALKEWLSKYDQVMWISDVCHYDMVLLIDIFGTAFDLPKNVGAACHDINQDIAAAYGISEIEAFDKSREEILSSIDANIRGDKHNALYDAKVIRQVYYACLPKLNNY